MRLFQPDTRHRRTLGAVFIITFVVGVLLTAFFYTQVLRGEQYAVASENNRLRPVEIPAPRGAIYDRNGDVVATSITGYSVSLLPASSETILRTLRDLAPFLGLSEREIARLLEKRNARPNDLLTVTESATFPQVAAIEERRAAFPNLMVVERPRRYYPAGAAIGHLIGYVSEITREELQLPKYRKAGYEQRRWVGKAGVEREYELTLGGESGARFVEVDAMGRVVDPRASVGALAPEPGEDLRVTLDLELQKYASEVFPDTMQGAIVAMVPSTGEVLAMYSNPSFDPNDFVGGIRTSVWSALRNDPANPLLDRTVSALYPPASTFKTATAAMGVAAGIVDESTHMPVACVGGMTFGGRYIRCWYRPGHGSLSLAQAIENSCNVYFYQLGGMLGLKKVTEMGTRMGFSRETGIDIPGEKAGIFPTGPEWYKERFGNPPMPSDVAYLAIGQGPNSQTPLRMALFYSAIAGNGTAPEPRLVVGGRPEADRKRVDLGLTPEGLAALWEGLRLVTEKEGTALQSSLARYKLYGKTGTAQNPHGDDHGWFVGFAGVPGGHPEVTVAVIVEKGLHGDAAAPLAAKIANFYLDRKYGLPFDPEPTLGERWRQNTGWWGWDPEGRLLIPPGMETRPVYPPGARIPRAE